MSRQENLVDRRFAVHPLAWIGIAVVLLVGFVLNAHPEQRFSRELPTGGFRGSVSEFVRDFGYPAIFCAEDWECDDSNALLNLYLKKKPLYRLVDSKLIYRRVGWSAAAISVAFWFAAAVFVGIVLQSLTRRSLKMPAALSLLALAIIIWLCHTNAAAFSARL
ncbi:MAG: hypothetical protein ACJ8C4_04490 [Gemmataceae bacterium]